MRFEFLSRQDPILRPYLSCLLSLLLYSILIAFLFVKWVVPVYGYSGFTFAVNCVNIFLSMVYIGIISYFITIQVDGVKTFFSFMLILQVIIPMFCLYSFTEEFMSYNIYISISVVCFIVISLTDSINIDLINNFSNVTFSRLFLPFMTIITCLTLARYIMLNGLGVFNLDITKVYDYRLLLRETMVGGFAYLDAWTVKVINPFCVVYSLYRRKKFLLIFFVTLQVVLFGFSSHKSVLFSAFVLVVFYYITPLLTKKKCAVVWCFILANLFPLCLYFKDITGIWCGLFKRLFITPATLNFHYYDYCTVNGFLWFRGSFLRHFIPPKYNINFANIIGLEYSGNIENHANTGFLGAGYAQGGFLVLIIYSVIIGVLISFIASLSKKIPSGLAVGITILPMSSLFTSGDLPSSLLTGGLLIALLLLYILSRDPTISSLDNR